MNEEEEEGKSRKRERRRNIRRRKPRAHDDDDDDNNNESERKKEEQVQVSAAAVIRPVGKGEAGNARPKRLLGGPVQLSFAEDEALEGKASKLKRRRKHHGGGGGLERTRPSQEGRSGEEGILEMATHMASSGEYTAERLRQLKEANRINTQALSEFALRGSFKPPNREEEEEEEGDDDDGAENEEMLEKRTDERLPEGRGGAIAIGDYDDKEEEVEHIPSAAEIKAAKRNRKRWRQINSSIPPADTANRNETSSDDDEDEQLNEGERLEFGILRDRSRPHKGRFVQENEEEWGEMKGTYLRRKDGGGYSGGSGGLGRQWTGDIDAQAKAAMEKLARSLEESRGREKEREIQVSLLREKVSYAEEKCASAESKLEMLRDQYEFLQETKQYLSDLSECLQEKAPIIEELEEQVEGIRKEASEKERELKKTVQSILFNAFQSGILQAMSLGGGNLTGEDSRKVSEAVERTETHLMSQHPEASRDSLAQYISLERLWCKLFKGITPAFLVADDDYPPEDAVSERLQKLFQFSSAAFDDTNEEFCSIEFIKRRLEHFKVRCRAAYFQAYVPESLPQLFSPFVRSELIQWDPKTSRQTSKASLRSLAWFETLESYGRVDSGGGGGGSDPEEALVPTLLEKILLPRLTFVISNCWEVTHWKQSQAIKSIVAGLFEHLGDAEESRESLQELLLTVRNKAHSELDQASIPMWPQKATACVPLSQAFAAYALKRALKLFRCILLWDGLLEGQVLVKLALEEVFAKRLLSYLKTLRNDAESLASILVFLCESIPKTWLGGGHHEADLAVFKAFVSECLDSWRRQQQQQTGGGGGFGGGFGGSLETIRRFLQSC